MKLKEIETLIQQKRYDEALSKCEELLEIEADRKSDILRQRSKIYALIDNYELAIIDYETIFSTGEGKIADYYLAAYWGLHSESFTESLEGFLIVLKMGDEQNETWFKSASFFYIAYIQMELEHFDEADLYLEKAANVESNVAMPIPDVGMCNAMQLREEILRRKNK